MWKILLLLMSFSVVAMDRDNQQHHSINKPQPTTPPSKTYTPTSADLQKETADKEAAKKKEKRRDDFLNKSGYYGPNR